MCAGNLNRRASAATVKGVLVEESSAVVLGDHVNVLHQETIGGNVQRTIQVSWQGARVRTSRWTQLPREDL